MARVAFLAALLLHLIAFVAPPEVPAKEVGPYVGVARAKGVINPPMANYVERTLADAQNNGASLYVLQLDTPGGLSSSMRDIVQLFLASRIPVVVYVSPAGGRAASAGTYITYSAHIAAMAPNTNIGSATPVAMGDGGGEVRVSDEMRAKMNNDAVSYLKGLANSRGRNAEWAEQAVREGANITDQEALALGVVEYLAPDLTDLLRQLDGVPVRTAGGNWELRTEGLPVRSLDTQPLESLLHAITDPTIAYLLLSLGSLALIYELSNPGAILPGVVGGLALLLALYALGTLPVNLAGLLLIAFAMVLFVFDLVAPSHGVLTLGAIVAFVLGSAMLINTPEGAPFFAIAPAAIAAMTLLLGLFFGVVVGSVIRSHRRRPAVDSRSLIGRRVVAREPLAPTGLVFVDGELWTATVDSGTVPKGASVEIMGIDGLNLRVRPVAHRVGEGAAVSSTT